MPASSAPVESPTPPEEVAQAGSWLAPPAHWYSAPAQAVAPPPPRSLPSEKEAVAATAAAVAEVVAGLISPSAPPPASLAAPFPSPPAARRQPAEGKDATGKKRSMTERASEISTAPTSKRNKTAASDATGALRPAAGTSPPQTPEATVTWRLASSEVAKAVRNENKEPWAAFTRSTAPIEQLRADYNRLEARVDAHGRGGKLTAMAAASFREAA
ncbi:hypothetical protein BU14_0227s0009 [Porphyra umbilicalis]|uniref:Uncharacterized protein n=1 Tax=Porphyra umbilicalis TaxID=2786 RepID=A0A1X6P4J5_PORUM|nr:hypothetical protein BU14_0227s0009 [Porphyra umbilicalis]|eukprot:OSX75670.1 hypothetical protein BU14_0227s0009 [Porphyra umbilicalis]